VPLVGDSLKDMQAAEAVGAQPILVLTGKGQRTRSEGGLPRRTLVFEDLAEAARHIIAHA
jgi:D-glycero-D-manno-heptose 1,7-bisphosphate phosphatase